MKASALGSWVRDLAKSLVGPALVVIAACSPAAVGGQDGVDFLGDVAPLPPQPIPASGPLPPMVDPALSRAIAVTARASAGDACRDELELLRRRNFGARRDAELRAAGLRALRELDDSCQLFAMPRVFATERNDVRRAVIEHLALRGENGQAALAWTAIHHDREDWRAAATAALARPATPATLAVMQSAFAASEHGTVERAGTLAGALDARVAIPHLIATQYSADTVRREGDLAWIAIGTQRSYVSNLIPVTGDGSGAFQPVPGIINEGFVFRVTDAVAVVYRTEVHGVLVDMSRRATGSDTSQQGWSLARWRDWYNRVYLPLARAEYRERLDELDAADYAEIERSRRREDVGDDLD